MRLSANFNPTNSLNIKPSDAQNLSIIPADIRRLVQTKLVCLVLYRPLELTLISPWGSEVKESVRKCHAFLHAARVQ